MFSIILLALFAASPFLYVQAQSSAASAPSALPTSLNQVPPCVLNCTSTAATQAGCNGLTDTTCVCTSQKFQAAAASCLLSTCSPQDQAYAAGLQSSLCGSGTQSPASATAASTATAPASTASSSTSKTASAASSLNVGLDTGHVIGLVAALLGAITGTLL